MPPEYDTLVENVRVVRPTRDSVVERDVAMADGEFAAVEADIPRSSADEVHDADGIMGFPGAIDAHTHVGIYRPPHEDAPSESASAVSGGVTTMLTYVRTGSLYMNRPGPIREFFPELLEASEGRYHTDYGYQVSPIEGSQIDEMEALTSSRNWGSPRSSGT